MTRHQRQAALTLQEVFRRLLAAYGPQGWWPVTDPGASGPSYDPQGRRGRPPMLTPAQQWEVMVGALLTQNTAWANVRKALAGLHEAGLTGLPAVAAAPREMLAAAVRPSGYYNQKAARLQLMARHLQEAWNGDVAALLNRPTPSVRAELLALKGVGPETADSILLYAGNGRHPVFVVDAYTYRLAARLGWDLAARDYGAHQRFFEATLREAGLQEAGLREAGLREAAAGRAGRAHLYGEFHALIVVHGKAHCTARAPRCEGCPLRVGCEFGQSRF